MTRYTYIAVDGAGRETRGSVDAADWRAACEQLAARGLADIRDATPPDAAAPAPRLNTTDAVELASFVSALAAAGLPMAAGARAVAQDLPTGDLSQSLRALAERLDSGESLEGALDALGPGLPAHVRAMMIAGARSGRLAQTLDELLEHERSMDDMGRRMWQAIMYPTILTTLLVAWLLFVALWLIPQIEFASLLDDMELYSALAPSPTETVPGYGRRLLEFSRIVPRLLVAVAGVVLIVVAAARAIGGWALFSRLVAQLPLFGPAWWYRSLVEFCGLLTTFLKQPMPLAEALRLVSLSAHDPAVRESAAQAADDVAGGRELASCLVGRALFPATLVNLAEWGARHSALADSLAAAKSMYRERFELQLRLLRIVLPSVVFLAVAASALLVAYAWMSSMAMAIRTLSGIW